jgi:cytochrome P450 family 144
MGTTAAHDLLDPATIQDPYELYRWMVAEAPVWNVPATTMYLVASWELVTEAVSRTEELSSNLDALLYTDGDGRPAVFDMTHLGTNISTLATADPPVHTAHRKVVFPNLVERQMTALEPTARQMAGELFDRMPSREHVEWTKAIAEPLPVAVLAKLMGFEHYDPDELVGWALDGAQLLAGTCSPEDMAHLGERAGQAAVYLAGELEAAPADPAAGIVGAVKGGVAEGKLTPEEAVSTLIILLGAGGESTAALIGNSVRMLAERSELQQVLRDDPARVPAFLEEVLRLESPFRGHYRTARRDTTLGGVTIPEGSLVYLLWAAANRDPAAFDDPDELRLDRPHVRGHLGFGRGIHFCVGAPLARMEARVAIETLLERTRSFVLDPGRPPAYVSSIFVRRHEHLDLITST